MECNPDAMDQEDLNLVKQILELERQLTEAKERLRSLGSVSASPVLPGLNVTTSNDFIPAYLHQLLLLSDSALPLGSFAFSSGLESFIAHQAKPFSAPSRFLHFLDMSLTSLSSATLPFVTYAFYSPDKLEILDNDFDASVSCVVARRASIAQGRALMGVWERSLRQNTKVNHAAQAHLKSFIRCSISDYSDDEEAFTVRAINGHLAPLFGAISAVLSIPIRHVLYVYLMNHVKTLMSAAVRASMIGPYQAQKLLAGNRMQESIHMLVEQELKQPRSTAEAGQNIPMLDIWSGRHDIVYSRIFNS